MSQLEQLQSEIVKFRNERDWKQFHTLKDLAIGLNVEASEVLEHFLWLIQVDTDQFSDSKRQDIGHELADTLYYVLLMANDMGINLEEAFAEKMKLNEQKYPIAKAKGNRKKYNEFQ